MTDLSMTIAPKSDQLNADDLIGGPKTITVTKVSASPSSPEQPVSIFFEGDNGKPYKPCKSMRRVLVQVWGKDGNQYAGRSMTLYRDPTVLFGGIAVGGIRISHMSHIDSDRTMALTASKASRKPFTVKPLKAAPASTAADPATKWTNAYLADLGKLETGEALEAFATRKAVKLEELRAARPDLHSQVEFALSKRRSELSGGTGTFTDDDEPTIEGVANEHAGDIDPFRAAADRLIAKVRAKEVFDEKDLADLQALPDAMRAEVDTESETV